MKTIRWFFFVFAALCAACEPVDLRGGGGDTPSVTIINNNDTTVVVCIGADEICDWKDNNCNGLVDDGIVCECITDEDCDDGVFCNGMESCGNNICQAAPGGACPAHLTCDEANGCVGCLTDNDCLGVEVCNATSHQCEPVSCPDDGDPCTTGAVHDHICEHAPINDCGHDPNWGC